MVKAFVLMSQHNFRDQKLHVRVINTHPRMLLGLTPTYQSLKVRPTDIGRI